MIVTQIGSISSPIHHLISKYIYMKNDYIIEKHLQLLHKLYPREFQGKLEELSVLNIYWYKLKHLYQ